MMEVCAKKVATKALNILFAACVIGYAVSAFYFHVNVSLFQFLAGMMATIMSVVQLKKERETLTRVETIVNVVCIVFTGIFALVGLVHLFI